MRAVAALALSGRYAAMGRQAAAGLEAWAASAGADLAIEDDRSEPERSARLLGAMAAGADLVFGPYGSGPARAVARAMAGRPEVVWNHGGAAVPRTGARVVDVLGPGRELLARAARRARGPRRGPRAGGRGALPGRVRGGGRRRGRGRARRAGAAARPRPRRSRRRARGRRPPGGARWVVGGGRADDDLALARALRGTGLRAGLVVCGVALAGGGARRRGGGLDRARPVGPGGAPPPAPLPAGSDYPAAQALAAGLLAERAAALAGSTAPGALWDAARAMRTETFLGPFAVDAEGRQTAHAPADRRLARRRGRAAAGGALAKRGRDRLRA